MSDANAGSNDNTPLTGGSGLGLGPTVFRALRQELHWLPQDFAGFSLSAALDQAVNLPLPAGMFRLPVAVFRTVTPNIDFTTTLAFYCNLLAGWAIIGVRDVLDQLHFLSNALHESAGFTRLEENLNYSSQRILTVFASHVSDLADAQALEFSPQALANRVYGNRGGNIAPDDGWRFRGRGIFQLTFAENYHDCAKDCGVTVTDDWLQSLTTPPGAVLSACWFWQEHQLTGRSLPGVCRIIHGDLTDYPSRLELFLRLLRLVSPLTPTPTPAPHVA